MYAITFTSSLDTQSRPCLEESLVHFKPIVPRGNFKTFVPMNFLLTLNNSIVHFRPTQYFIVIRSRLAIDGVTWRISPQSGNDQPIQETCNFFHILRGCHPETTGHTTSLFFESRPECPIRALVSPYGITTTRSDHGLSSMRCLHYPNLDFSIGDNQP